MRTRTKRKAAPPVANGHATPFYAGTNGQPLPLAPATYPAVSVAPPPAAAATLRLDFGCGPNPREGFDGVDSLPFGGRVKYVVDLTKAPWPWPDCSVAEANASHFIEHLTNLDGRWERVRFFNELYRVLAPGGKCTIIVPHWCSNRYYGDPTHKEVLSEMAFYYLLRSWRLGDPAQNVPGNAPHTDVLHNPDGYSCDFDATWGYGVHPTFQVRSQEAQQFALQFYKEAATDLICTVTKRA